MILRCLRNRCLNRPLLDVTPTRNEERATMIEERGIGNGKLRAGSENEERRTENEERGTGNGEQRTENGERRTRNGERRTRNGEF